MIESRLLDSSRAAIRFRDRRGHLSGGDKDGEPGYLECSGYGPCVHDAEDGRMLVSTNEDIPFDEEQCAIQSFDAKKNKWHITLSSPKYNNKELIVPESALRISFCLLPDSVHQCKTADGVVFIEDDAQGTCGSLAMKRHASPRRRPTAICK